MTEPCEYTEESRVRTLSKIRRVKKALCQGRAPEAAAFLEEIEAETLRPEEEALCKTYQKRALLDSERLQLERKLLENEEHGAWPRVRDNLADLRALARFEEQLLAKREEAIMRRIVRQHSLRYLDLAGSVLHMGDCDYYYLRDGCPTWLLADGKTVALPTVLDRWAIVRLLDCVSARGKGAIVFRVEEDFEFMDFMVWEDSFWLAGKRGEVYAVTPDGANFQVAYPPCPHLRAQDTVVGGVLAPPDHLWLRVSTPQDKFSRVIVLDLKQRTLCELGEGVSLSRNFSDGSLRIFRAAQPSALAINKNRLARQEILPNSADMDDIPDSSIPSPRVFIHGPDGRQLSLPGSAGLGDSRDLFRAYSTFHKKIREKINGRGDSPLATDGEGNGEIEVDHSSDAGIYNCLSSPGLAVSKGAGCVFSHQLDNDNNRHLRALSLPPNEVNEKWRVDGVAPLIFVSDYRGERVRALFVNDGRGVTVAALESRKPASWPRQRPAAPGLRLDLGALTCFWTPEDKDALISAWCAKLQKQTPTEQQVTFARLLAVKDLNQLMAFYSAILRTHLLKRFPNAYWEIAKIDPKYPDIVVGLSSYYARIDRIAESLKVIEKFDFTAVPAEQAEHIYHLLGVARLRQGDISGAVQAWREGLERCGDTGDGCRLGELARSVEEAWPGSGDAGPEEELANYAWLLQVMEQADNYLRAGEGDKVLALLDCERHWFIATRHSVARLVQACLLREPTGDAEQLQWLINLSYFVAHEDESRTIADPCLLPPRLRLPPQRLKEWHEKARQWLERA